MCVSCVHSYMCVYVQICACVCLCAYMCGAVFVAWGEESVSEFPSRRSPFPPSRSVVASHGPEVTMRAATLPVSALVARGEQAIAWVGRTSRRVHPRLYDPCRAAVNGCQEKRGRNDVREPRRCLFSNLRMTPRLPISTQSLSRGHRNLIERMVLR
jgi:hypothetical protein